MNRCLCCFLPCAQFKVIEITERHCRGSNGAAYKLRAVEFVERREQEWHSVGKQSAKLTLEVRHQLQNQLFVLRVFAVRMQYILQLGCFCVPHELLNSLGSLWEVEIRKFEVEI